jgi:hypothetical protein
MVASSPLASVQTSVGTPSFRHGGALWMPLYGVLQAAGLGVGMANDRQTENLPGHKTDMRDCQLGAPLHPPGLLPGGPMHTAHVRQLRNCSLRPLPCFNGG